jgi:hypothetical protein
MLMIIKVTLITGQNNNVYVNDSSEFRGVEHGKISSILSVYL